MNKTLRTEEDVLQELTDRISKTCGITRHDLGRSIYVRFGDAQVHLVVVDVETPGQLRARLQEQDEKDKRMEAFQKELLAKGIDLAARLYYVEEGELPK